MKLPKDLIVSISGVRGLSPSILSPEVAYALAWSFSRILPAGTIVVSRDSRKSGFTIKRAVLRALIDSGRKVLDADLIPLPTTQVAVEESGAVGAIDITASHNPSEYNGLKFLNSLGIFIDAKTLEILKEAYTAFSEKNIPTDFSIQSERRLSIVPLCEQSMEWHMERLEGISGSGKKITVAVDAVNGAGSMIIPSLLKNLGCDVIHIATDPTADFPHTPEPNIENLRWTQSALAKYTYDFCVVVDPDADRLVLIDENKNILPEELTLPMVVEEKLASGARGPVVINMSTSRVTEDICMKYGVPCVRSAVGEINVVQKMMAEKAIIGGEGNGGIIDPQIHLGRDSLVGIVHIIQMLRRQQKSLSKIAMEMPKYIMQKTKINIPQNKTAKELYELIGNKYPEAKQNKVDGLRLDWSDKWIHLRPSNTEPIFRIIGEAKNDKILKDLINEVTILCDTK